MKTIEGTKNFLYSIKFEEGEEENWSEAEKMKHTEEARIHVLDFGYKFIREFCSVPFSGYVNKILDKRR